ncbi:hypothetical protein [Beijerinckia sp. L45]|uniref:hypothetical protein n=1 Tax=Beijerinckia sp. L45 TaxID=1641855 RepID=UPI001FEF08E5|nr:hypothetical protein [Beijerinckia sp. L45]
MDDTSHDLAPEAEAEVVKIAEPAPRAHSPSAVLSLKQAMRRARFDDAERTGVVADLRAARLGRLEVLQEALKPLLAQIPDDVDCFDVGVMPGANPRLFIDMIGFVEMGRDPRVYRFVQDTRHGRVKLAESESVDAMVEAATHYVARRLLERDKALAAYSADDPPPRRTVRPRPIAPTRLAPPLESHAPERRSLTQVLATIFAFFIDVLGSIAFFSLLAFAAWVAWSNYRH